MIVVAKFGILSRATVLFLFLIFNFSFSNKNIEYENEQIYEKTLDNIKFKNIEKSDSLLGISKVKILNINGNLYGIINFNDGKKHIIKREKDIEVNKNRYKVRVSNEEVIEIKDREEQIIYIKATK